MQNLGQLGPENCRAYVFFAWCFFFFFFFGCCCCCCCCCFVCLFSPSFFFFLFPPFFFFFFFFFYSSPDLNLHLYSILHDFSFKNTKFSASERAHSPQTPPVCASMQLALTLHQIIPQSRTSPNVEDGCTALCSFGVLAVVKCLNSVFLQCFVLFCFFFSFLIHKFPAILS